MRILIVSVFVIWLPFRLMAQKDSTVLNNMKISDAIRTIKFCKKGNELSHPILNFGKNDFLDLKFDLVGIDYGDLAYEIILCDKDWIPTRMDKYEYINGFETVYIRDFQYSINTYVNYRNYKTQIPTDDFSFKMSGNYIVRVFPEEDPTTTLFQRRFIVAESLINVDAKIVQPQVVMDQKYKQQVEFNIKYPSTISDPLTNLYVTIRQNRNWKTAKTNLQADYVRDQKLFFNDYTQFVFDGNNEFRQIDLKFNRGGNLEIAKIVKEEGQYQVYIKENKPKPYNNYVFKEELNGKYTIKNDEATDNDIESDYFKVHFELISGYFMEGDVYVFGELTNWELSDEFKMEYDPGKQKYFLDKDVKQGMVNYCFAIKDKKSAIVNIEKIEGNHFATENDYDIILYYRDISNENDRVLGVYSFNSLY
ncbi:MAG: DUF5103 domain-containing protein [Crocinitomicaceae bacterium]|nr:DUF5103 domain-containing protein [Crocinitomicaceae bacterium]